MSNVEKVTEKINKQINKEHIFLFSDCVLVNGNLYSVTNMDGLPVKVNLKSRKMVYINEVKKYDFVNSEDIISDNDEIYLLELNGCRMMKFNIKTNLCEYYNILCHKENWGNYAAYAKFKNYIYIFPKYINYIVKINLKSNKIEKDFRLYKEMERIYRTIDLKNEFIFFWYGVHLENEIWLFQKNRRDIIIYNLETENWKKTNLPLEIDNCIHVVMKDDKFYILSLEGYIYTWDIKKNNMYLFADCSDGLKGNNFFKLIITNDIIYVLPCMGKDIYWINRKNAMKGVYNDYPEDFEYFAPEGWSKYLGYCEDEDNYYLAMRSSKFILCINKNNGEIKWLKITTPTMKEYLRACYKPEELLEEKRFSLRENLSIVEKRTINNIGHNDRGKKIFDLMKGFSYGKEI